MRHSEITLHKVNAHSLMAAGSATYDAVCFDLDGVIVHTMPLHAQAWQEALKARGLRVQRCEIYAWEGEPGSVTAFRLLSRGKGKALPKSILPLKYHQTSHGYSLAQETKNLLQDKERRFNRLAQHVRPSKEWRAILSRLAKRGVRLGLVTGASRRELKRLLSKSILQYFQVMVTGDSVRHGKPNPEPYRIAFKRIRVDSKRIVVVENAPYGVRSAKRAHSGFVLALVSSLPATYLRDADQVVYTTQQLSMWLDRLTSVSRVR